MNLGHLDFDIVSTARCPAENFELRISDFASLGIFTLVKSPLQIDPFMQNKPNFRKSQMNVSAVKTMNYEQITMNNANKNKPNSNPIKPNFRNAQMNVSSLITKDYIKYDDFAVRKNKPNSKPISERPKMSTSVFVTKDYDNVTAYRLQKNKPNQTQSLVKDLNALVNAWMFISKTVKKSCSRLWALLQCFSENFDKPGELKAECSARLKLRTDPMNLLGIMPAKEGKIDLKHSFRRSAFCFSQRLRRKFYKGDKNERD